MNPKAKGSRVERECVHLLESLGYSVTKAGGSLGCWDLVAIHPTHTRLIQVKSNRKPAPAERERLQLFRAPPGHSKEIWIRKDGYRVPVVEVL